MNHVLSEYAKIMDKLFDAYKTSENGLNDLDVYRKITHLDEFTRRKIDPEIDKQTEDLRAQIDNWERSNSVFHIYLYTLLENLHKEHDKSIKDVAILASMIDECYNDSEQKTLAVYLSAIKQAFSEIGVSHTDIEKGFKLGIDKIHNTIFKTDIEIIDGNIIKFPFDNE